MRLGTSLVSVLLLVVLAVCLLWPLRALPPRLIDHCGDEGNPRSSASIIIVGVVQSDIVVLRPVPMHTHRTTPLQMRRMQVEVENVLRGDIRSERVEIY